jgi:hypothetical protein
MTHSRVWKVQFRDKRLAVDRKQSRTAAGREDTEPSSMCHRSLCGPCYQRGGGCHRVTGPVTRLQQAVPQDGGRTIPTISICFFLCHRPARALFTQQTDRTQLQCLARQKPQSPPFSSRPPQVPQQT